MPQRKKNQNKQNSKIIKKTTLQEINYTEELRIPTSIAQDSKQLGKSIELRKSNSRKPASRKSQCTSVKQQSAPLKLKDLLKQFNSLKLISSKSKSPKSNKESRSKFSKSKNKKKNNVNVTYSHHHTKMNTQLNSRANSQVNLTAKLEKTIKKLKQTEYFIDEEDSDIPFISTSSAFTPQQKHRLQIIENQQEEDINIRQMRMFCSSGTFGKNSQNSKINRACPYIKRSIEILKGNIYETMARKIQRAWRRYRTHKLITRYSENTFNPSIFDHFRENEENQRLDHSSNSGESSQRHDDSHSDIMIESDQLYPQQMQNKKITYISNLQQSDSESQIIYNNMINQRQQFAELVQQQSDEQLKVLKQSQLQKWNEIVNLLENCHKNPKQKEKLLNQLMQKLQINKQLLSQRQKHKQQQKDQDQDILQIKQQYVLANPMIERDNEQQIDQSSDGENDDGSQEYVDQREDVILDISKKQERVLPKRIQNSQVTNKKHIVGISRHKRQSSSHSSSSIKMMEQQFNSKKYIEYLDSDMYPKQQNQINYNTRLDVRLDKKLIEQSLTISKKKQDLLLMKLKADPTRITNKNMSGKIPNIDENIFKLQGQIRSRLSYRSNSELSCQSNQVLEYNEDIKNNENGYRKNPRKKSRQLRKSSSEKIFKFLESAYDIQEFAAVQHTQEGIQQERVLQQQKQDQQLKSQNKLEEQSESSQENVQDLLTKFVQKQLNQFDFQQNIPTNQKAVQQFDRCYSESELVKQLAELKRLRDEDSEKQEHSQQFVVQKLQKDEDESDDEPVLHRTDGQLHKINIQNSDRRIDSDEDEEYQEFQNDKIILNRNMSKEISDIAQKAQGISEVLFHQILIQVLKDMAKFPNTILRKFKVFALEKKTADQTQITMNSNRPRRATQQSKKNGFMTNQAEIRKFIQEIIKGLLNQEPHIFKNLQKSTGPSALQMLKYMHQSEQQEIILEDQEDDPSVMVLPNWIFDVYWGRKSKTLKYQRQSLLFDEEKQKQRQQYLKSLNKIFYRSLFDCLNECLDFQRNFGPVGKPFPWKKSPQFEHIKTYSDIMNNVKNAQKRLLQISATYCGIIIQRDEMLTLCGSQDYLDQVQEDRLSRMLAQDLVQGEDRWIFYDDEQTELLVEISNTLYFEIMWECVNQVYLMDAVKMRI